MIPGTIALQAPLSVGILQARILEWFAGPPPGDLPNPEIEPRSPDLQAESLPTELRGKPFVLVIYILISKGFGRLVNVHTICHDVHMCVEIQIYVISFIYIQIERERKKGEESENDKRIGKNKMKSWVS